MEKMLRQKKFYSLSKFLHILFTILMILTSVASVGVLLLISIVGITSEESVVRLVEKGDITASLNLNGIQLMLSEKVISSFSFDKSLFISLLLIYFGYLIVLTFIIFFVKRLLSSFKKGKIFTEQNSRYMEWISYGFIILSLTIKPIQTFTFYTADQLFNLNELIQTSEWLQNVTYSFFGIHWSLLFGGLVIWIIGRTFKYGAFLQEEYDATA